MSLRKLIIVDGDGKERVIAGTFPNGEATVQHYDRDGKLRIAAVTLRDGTAAIQHFDREENKRIGSLTSPDGMVVIGVMYRKGKVVWTESSE
jgi:hypothetical protein